LWKIIYLQGNTTIHLLSYKPKQGPCQNKYYSERDFSQLDRLLHQKSNTSTLCLEEMILFANKKMSKWLDPKSPEERKELLGPLL